MAEPNEAEYLKAKEVASLFRVSPKTVSRWAKEGKIPHIRTLGGHRRYPRGAVMDLARTSERGFHQDRDGPES